MIVINSFNLDAISFIPLYSPKNASKVEIINAGTTLLYLRSNPTDVNTQLEVLPGEKVPFEAYKNIGPWDTNQIVLYGKLASSTGTVKVIAH